MKSSFHSILTAVALFGVVPNGDAQAPTTRSGRPVDPKAIENLNRINDERAKRGQPPITAPGYTYTPADKRAPVQPAAETKAPDAQATVPATEANAPVAQLRWVELLNRPEFWPAQCTMKQTMEFQGGATVKAGQKVKVDGLSAKEIALSTLDGKTQFTAAPEETDVLTDRKDVAFVSWPTDATTPAYLEYARANSIPWPSLPAERKSLFANLGVFEIPGILVVDRFGKRVLATNTQPGAPLEAADATLARLNESLGP